MNSKPLISAAVIQMSTDQKKDSNLARANQLCQQAINNGATLLALPELFNSKSILTDAEPIPGPSTQPLINLSVKHNVTIIAGSILEQSSNPHRPFNTSILISDTGSIIKTYRKIHLFKYRTLDESTLFTPGTTPEIGIIKPKRKPELQLSIGLSICYDIRFPELYRHYALQSATVLSIPAAFTKPTGEAHWEPLLRARAIENQCFILAPNQVGIGSHKLEFYGNSMIIDPWGTILARGSSSENEVIYATLDLNHQHLIRNTLPCLSDRILSINS